MATDSALAPEASGGPASRPELEDELEGYRRELTGYCYRMLGSGFDAEDAVQEAMVRAWRKLDAFEGRSSFRSWVYRIATNVCLDQIDGRKRRATPMDLEAVGRPVIEQLRPPLHESTWVLPAPDTRVLPEAQDPADLVAARESVQLAFVAALQHLPARQRAVLILRDVLRWTAEEVARLLEATTATVNSLLQRARATLAKLQIEPTTLHPPEDEQEKQLLERYLEAFERYDIEELVKLLHEDATQTMPPFSLWLRGRDDIATWMLGPGAECRGSRVVPVRANGLPGFAQYRPSGPDGQHEPWGICLLETDAGRVTGLRFFLAMTDPRLFAYFGLPETPPADAVVE